MTRVDTSVRDYYDRHTNAFVTLGQGGRLGAIHRAVWGPGVTDRVGAFHYVEDRIADLIRHLSKPAASPHIVDLGCGVGASLRYLATVLPIRGTGITLSPVQARLASQEIARESLSDRVVCLEGDYSDLPRDLAPADLAFAIESFVHTPDPARFFDQCRTLIRPGGLLVVCDDFRRTRDGSAAARAIDLFREGWHINTLIEPGELEALARAAGFEHESTTDLSPYLEIHRTRDRLIDALLWLLRPVPVARTSLDYLYGGRALQTCLAKGWIGYDLVAFRRVSS